MSAGFYDPLAGDDPDESGAAPADAGMAEGVPCDVGAAPAVVDAVEENPAKVATLRPDPADGPRKGKEKRKPMIEFLRPSEIAEYVTPENHFLVGDSLIQRGALTIFAGPGGVGKSRAVFSLAVSAARGESNWMGFPIHFGFKTMVVQSENGLPRLSKDFKNLGDAAGLDNRMLVSAPPDGMIAMKNPNFRDDLTAAAPNFDSYISQQRQIAVAQAAQRDQFQPQIVDVGDSGRQAFLQSRGSAQLLPDGTEADKSRPKIMVTEHGIAVIDPSTGAASLVKDASGNPVMPMPKAGANKGIDPVAILASDDFKKKLDPVNDRIIDLSAKVVSGNKYWGPDWLPAMGRTTYADQLRAEQVRRDALMQTAPAGYNAAVPAGPAAPAGDTHSEGDTATNPQTGARMVYQSGNWVAAGTSGGGVDRASALKAAQDAIANGADPAAVNARLQKLGFR